MVLRATSSTVSRLSARIRCLRLKLPDHLSRRSASSLLVETVSDAIERVDRVEGRVDRAELAADALDVAVDGAVVDINIVTIGNIEQLVARFYDPRPLSERLEDQELGDGQADDPTIPQHLMPRRVDSQPAALERRGVRFGGARRRFTALELPPPEDRANACDQQPLRERLRDIIVRAHREAQRL